jgi:hypothetical protein
MIACSGNLASSSVAFSGPGGSANVARSAKRDTAPDYQQAGATINGVESREFRR